MPIGPLMIDLAGLQLTTEDEKLLQHPLIGGVILFSRNFKSPKQLGALIQSIRDLWGTVPIRGQSPTKVKGTVPAGDCPRLIAVDQEGGRVQRFREGFTALSSAAQIGALYDENPESAMKLAQTTGQVMATELLACGVDFSFAPVLDLNKGISQVIDDRAFHADSEVVTKLAGNFIKGMQKAGMQAVGKHFPGHGSVLADSHTDLPKDTRSLDEIKQQDMKPFLNLIKEGLSAIMPAHIVFDRIDEKPVGFSSIWLQDILRKNLGFNGAIFSDDLCMKGAAIMGDTIKRAKLALAAGCDMILICNNRKAVCDVVKQWGEFDQTASQPRLEKMRAGVNNE